MSEDNKPSPIPRGKDFNALVEAVNKQYKFDIGTLGSNLTTIDTEFKYSTGILSLDRYLGIGGFLGGRILDVYGHEGNGKTLFALTMAAAIQKQKFASMPGNQDGFGRAVMLDAESTFNPAMAQAVGVDLNRLTVFKSTPERILTGEDYFNLMKIFIQNGVELIIVDSAPALVPSARMEATIGEGQKASHANMMSEGLQQLIPLLNGHKRTLVLFINQIRMAPMVKFGSPEKPTGGEALKYYASYRLEMFKSSKDGDIVKSVPSVTGEFEDRRVGVQVRAKLVKNKTATLPIEPITFDIYFESVTDQEGVSYTTGVDIYKDIVDVAVMSGVIEQNSSYFRYGALGASGKANLIKELKAAGPELLQEIRNKVLGK